MMMNSNQNNLVLDMASDILSFQCKEYLAIVQKLQKVTNANDNNNNHTSCTKYFQQSGEQYYFLSLFIRDDSNNNDKQSDEVTINFIIA